MANSILSIVNYALGEIGEIPLSAIEFDNGVFTAQSAAREAVQEILQDMRQKKSHYLYKQEFTIATVASQPLYTVAFPLSYLASTKLRVITADNTDSWLRYLPESEALENYIDFNNLTQTGRPSEWFVVTSTSPGNVSFRVNPIPDDVYTISGFRYSNFSRVTSAYITSSSDTGDRAIQKFVAFKVAQRLQSADAAILEQEYQKAWHTFLVEDFHDNNINTQVIPAQQYSGIGYPDPQYV